MSRALLTFLCLALVGATALAAEKVFRKEVRQIVGTAQSQDDARTAAIAKAKRDALEEAGSWLESVSEVKNMKLVRDDVLTLSSGITRTRVLEEEPFLEGRAVGIRVVAEVTVDNSGLAERVREFLADRERVSEKKAESARERELLDRLDELEKRMVALQAERASRQDVQMAELDRSMAANRTDSEARKPVPGEPQQRSPAAPAQAPAASPTLVSAAKAGDESASAAAEREEALRREIQENSRRLAAQEAFRKGESFSNEPGKGIRYTDPRAAIAAFTEAIALDPAYADAYSRRGRAHTDLKEYPRALEDINRALHLDPGLGRAYIARAKTYVDMGENRRAIEDASEAIRLLPEMPNAYTIRGRALNAMGEYQQALIDYDQAVRLSPRFPVAYAGRAGVRRNLGDRSGAREDATRACELGFQPACDRVQGGRGRR